MVVNSTLLIALVLIGATVPSFAEEEPKQTFTCTAKTFNECLMEAPCSAWKRVGSRKYIRFHFSNAAKDQRDDVMFVRLNFWNPEAGKKNKSSITRRLHCVREETAHVYSSLYTHLIGERRMQYQERQSP